MDSPTLALMMLGITLVSLFSGYLVGWNAAVDNHRHTRKLLETSVGDLEQQVAAFRAAEDNDPQRAWIDMGKRHVINQIVSK